MNNDNEYEDIEFIDLDDDVNTSNPAPMAGDVNELSQLNEDPSDSLEVSNEEPISEVFSEEPSTLETPEDLPDLENAKDTSHHSSGSSSTKKHGKKHLSKAERRRRRRRKKLIRFCVFVAALILFLVSGGILLHAFIGYQKADKIYNDVSKSIFGDETAMVSVKGTGTNSSNSTTTSESEEVKLYTSYDHTALLAQNSDAVGYLQIPAIDVLLPVVQGDDNSYYLNHAFNGASSSNGTLFVDYRQPDGVESQNCIIYGHDMRNGSMFGALNKFVDSNFVSTGQNRYFYFYVNDKIYKYEIYAVHQTPAIGYTYTASFNTANEFLTYVSEMSRQSYYSSNVKFTGTEKTMTFSTCTNDDDIRLVVQGVRVAELDIATIAKEQGE
ncbi:MAG: class B sortase [Lachnospiraceae bacterium]|nr:class B sortase [Lachnospiraceae bacterium]